MDCELKIEEPPKELLRFIKMNTKFIIAGHKEPDGDCIGSQLALRSALLRMGKEVIVCSAGPFKRTEIRDFTKLLTSAPKKEDCVGAKVIIVDCSSKDRTGGVLDFLEPEDKKSDSNKDGSSADHDEFPCAIIDHHTAVTNPLSTAHAPVYVDAKSPSCTLLIYNLIKALGLQLTSKEATLLFFGLCTDTGFFRHLTEKNAAVFEAAAAMVNSGANPKKIFNIINGGKSLNSRILTGRILSKTESHFEGKLLLSYETLDEYSTYGFESRDSDSLNQLLLSIQGVEATVIIRQECAENCTVSLRSIDKINVAQIAFTFGGGGHKNAAGLSMKGDLSFVKQKILDAFFNIFNS